MLYPIHMMQGIHYPHAFWDASFLPLDGWTFRQRTITDK